MTPEEVRAIYTRIVDALRPAMQRVAASLREFARTPFMRELIRMQRFNERKARRALDRSRRNQSGRKVNAHGRTGVRR